MKKNKIFLFILLLVVATGCGKQDINIKINNDKSFDMKIEVSLNKDAYNKLKESEDYLAHSKKFDKEFLDNYRNNGYTVERESTSQLEMFSISKHFNNIDDYSSREKIIYEINGLFRGKTLDELIFKRVENEKVFSTDGNGKYFGNFIFSEESNEKYKTILAEYEIIFSVDFESKPITHNADQEINDGKRLLWVMKYGDSKEINFEFLLSNLAKSDKNNTIYYIIGGVALIGVVGYFVIAKKKTFSKKPNNEIKE